MNAAWDWLQHVDLNATGQKLLSLVDTTDPIFQAIVLGLLTLLGAKMAAPYPALRNWGLACRRRHLPAVLRLRVVHPGRYRYPGTAAARSPCRSSSRFGTCALVAGVAGDTVCIRPAAGGGGCLS